MRHAYFDSHMHTALCKHAFGEPEEYAAHAIAQGLQGIIFTCHSPMPDGFWPHVRMSEADFDDYVAMIGRCRDRFAGDLEVRLGMESDYFPGFEKWIEKLHRRADFHYCLGSVHWQGPEYRQMFESGDKSSFRRTYFQNLAASAETGLFDSLAHPDLVKNYYPDSWSFVEWQDDIAAALDRIAATGIAMEINTSGLHKNYSEMNPGPDMLRMMSQRRIPIVIGSDSHNPKRVGENFIAALEGMQQAGYSTVSIFENRKRKDLPLADILADRIRATRSTQNQELLASAA